MAVIIDQTRPDQTRPDQTRPDQTRPDQTRPDQNYAQNTGRLSVLYVFSWYTPYSAHNTPFGGNGFFSEHVRSLQPYCDTTAYVPFDSSINEDFTDEEEWGIRTLRAKFPPVNFEKSVFERLSRMSRVTIQFAKNFRKVCRLCKPDIIHAHAAVNAGFCSTLFSKFTCHIPVVVTEHLSTKVMGFDNWMSRIKHHLTYKLAAKAVCVSTDQRDSLHNAFKDVDFTVVYNGIHDRKTDNTVSKYRREGYINCDIVAGFYGKEVKGFEFLLPAIKILSRDIPIVLHICGGGEFLDYYKNMAEELGVMDNCIFYGQCTRDKVYAVISEMDFGISASIIESAGVSVEETMLMGKPLVVTKSGGANSLVTDYSAYVVEAASTEALVEGIRKMSETYRDFDSKAIRDYALKNFEIHNIALQYLDIYHECLRKRNI